MAETTPASLWKPENLLICLLKCLALLLRWVTDRVCPSFFQKDSNLFYKDGFVELAYRLESLIDLLLKRGHQFLYEIKSDRVGEMLRGGDLMLYKPVSDFSINKYIYDIDRRAINCSIFVFRNTTRPHDSAEDSLSFYMSKLEEFKHVECFPGHTEEDTKDALCHALPWLHLSIGLEFAALAVTCPNTRAGENIEEKVDTHFQQARNTDLVNIRLAHATILWRLEKLDACFLLLRDLEISWTDHVIAFCPCEGRGLNKLDAKQYFQITSECRGMALRKHAKERYASCAIFDRSQIELVPSPLRFEMLRSLYTQSGSRHEAIDAWFDRAALDAKVYLYLLQYLVSSKLRKEYHKQIAIDNLASIALPDKPEILSHRETAFNLLGWIYLQERRVGDAIWCFLKSWQIRPHHNAAKLHVLVESYRQAVARERQQDDT